MNINAFDLQFFEIATLIRTPLTEESSKAIRQLLLKLKNPTYYSKYTAKHPANSFGYYKNSNINPVLVAITNMLYALKEGNTDEEKLKNLQKEYSWAFNNYSWYLQILNNTNSSISIV